MVLFSERRKWRRVQQKIRITAILVDPSQKEGLFKLDPVWTKDVAGNGLGLITCARLAVGVKIDLKLQLPGQQKTIEAKGRVVWSQLEEGSEESYRIGVAFEHIAERDRLAIMKFVEAEARRALKTKAQ